MSGELPTVELKGNASLSSSTPELADRTRTIVPASRSSPQFGSQRKIEYGPIIIGVCAMRKKAQSKPMKELTQRLTSFTTGGLPEFRVIFFEEEMILNAPIEEWPLCEALIAFFSGGFPLKKAAQYAELRRPLVLNDLEKQEMLFDRRQVYQMLE